MESSLTVF